MYTTDMYFMVYCNGVPIILITSSSLGLIYLADCDVTLIISVRNSVPVMVFQSREW